jgi:hypothetical protein
MEVVMPEHVLLPMLGVFGPLVVATLAAYFWLNREDLHTRGRH